MARALRYSPSENMVDVVVGRVAAPVTHSIFVRLF
jgi:hypothetical protein